MGKRILISYGSRYGTTAEIAQFMSNVLRELGHNVDVIDLKQDKPPTNLDEYSLVVVGSGIRAGKWTREPLKFLEEIEKRQANIQVALFVVCGFAANPERSEMVQSKYLNDIIEKLPSLHILSKAYFAGMFDFSKYNRFVRALVKQIAKREASSDGELPEKIDFRDWKKIRDWTTSLIPS